MLECVYIVRSCTGNVVQVSDDIPWESSSEETCECCGDYVTRIERVYFIRCESEGTLDYACVNPNAYLSMTDIKCADELRRHNAAVYLVPECGEPDWDRMYGKPI